MAGSYHIYIRRTKRYANLTQQVAVMRKDYEGLKARYYNDTQESQMTGRSNVFV